MVLLVSQQLRRFIIDILLNEPEHDCVWTNAPMTKERDTTQPFTQTVGQRLKILLLTFAGEWFFDTSYGVPYWESILGRKTTKARVDLIFSQKILSEPGVKEITYFKSTFINRVYSLDFKVRVVDGTVTDTITVSPTNL